MNILICAGHSKRMRGAKSRYLNISEWSAARIFVSALANKLLNNNHTVTEISDSTLIKKVNYSFVNNYDLALDFHFNTANSTEQGHKCFYWNDSKKGEFYAKMINKQMCHNYTHSISKIIKAYHTHSFFLRKMNCPAVVVELAYIDNYEDFKTVFIYLNDIVTNIVTAIHLSHKFLLPHISTLKESDER